MATINFSVEREYTLKAGQSVTLEDGEQLILPEIADIYFEFELEIEGSASPYVPARLSGHPDNWCPAEGGEVEIEYILYQGKPWKGKLTDCELSHIEEDLRLQAANDAEEAWAESKIAAYEDREYDRFMR